MITEQALAYWLSVWRFQTSEDHGPLVVPDAVAKGWVAKGWVVGDDDTNWKGEKSGTLTDAGAFICDLNDADLGIEWAEDVAADDETDG